MSTIQPQFKLGAFQCPYCQAHAQMQWNQLRDEYSEWLFLYIAKCTHCRNSSVWQGPNAETARMIEPKCVTAPKPHPDMPEACLADYEEAREIAGRSPRGAAALLRLVVQKLCIELNQPGKNINDDIKALVRNGLPVDAQQALDILRVTGNNAVHPGEMDIDANPGLVAASFELINFIVDQQIAQKKRIANLFSALPEGAKAAIARRDGA